MNQNRHSKVRPFLLDVFQSSYMYSIEFIFEIYMYVMRKTGLHYRFLLHPLALMSLRIMDSTEEDTVLVRSKDRILTFRIYETNETTDNIALEAKMAADLHTTPDMPSPGEDENYN